MPTTQQETSAGNGLVNMGDREFRTFRELVHEHTGIWLRDGKHTMLASRLAKPVRRLGLPGFEAYYALLRTCPRNSPEFVEFINCVTTNKTSFFRENHHFDFLRSTVVPEMKAAALRNGPRRTRIWSAASSTGEEVYSIAITLLETLPPNSWTTEVIGSDIDTGVLATAQRAVYPATCLSSIDRSLHQRYFLRGKGDMSGSVKVKPEVTRLVDLRRINLMDKQWPIEGPLDAIFFRNALIYFKQEVQDVFLRRMARLLKPGGYLFLGNSEHIPWLRDVLEPLNQTVYRLRSPGRGGESRTIEGRVTEGHGKAE